MGGRNACCKNTHPPDKLKNTHNFPTQIVDKAASIMHRWFKDDELGMCRVVKLGGHKRTGERMGPVLFYQYVDKQTGDIGEEFSSIEEVVTWVEACPTNI